MIELFWFAVTLIGLSVVVANVVLVAAVIWYLIWCYVTEESDRFISKEREEERNDKD